MHIVLAAFALLAGAAIWWYRLKMMRDAAGEVADAVGRVRESIRRKKLRHKAGLSPVSAIDSPVVAAATVIAAIASADGAMAPAQEEALRGALREVADAGAVDEAVIYGKWAAAQVADPKAVIDETAAFLAGRLDDAEKADLMSMVSRVAGAGPSGRAGSPLLMRLEHRLGLKRD